MGKDSLLSEKVQDDLDRQLFHLRTLYDVSHELLGVSDIQDILKSFLLMTMGNFGAIQGFIMGQDSISRERTYFEPVGFYESDHLLLEQVASQLLVKTQPEGVEMLKDILRGMKSSIPDMVCVAAFKVDEKCSGMMGLGKKLIDSEYRRVKRTFYECINFRIDMISPRCKFIPQTADECPGRISECSFCKTAEGCHQSGGTTFQVLFPAGRQH